MTDALEPGTNGPPPDGDATPATFEHEIAWAALPAQARPVVAQTTPPRSGRARWAIAIGVIALVLATTVGVSLLITGQTSTSTVIGYVPADSVMYGEVRLDLPGDQRRAVGEFLSKFPGFADQAALDTKLDQVLDDLVSSATNQGQTYTKDIKPWFDGRIGLSVGPLPPAASLVGGNPAVAGSFRGLALISVKDPVAAQSWFDAAIAKRGASITKETYGGATLTVFAKTGGVTAAVAVIGGKVVAAGDIASVKAAIDTGGSSGFASAPGPKAAIDASTGDYVGFVYVALRPAARLVSTELSRRPSRRRAACGTAALGQAILKVIPDWGAYWLRFESDAVVMEAVAPKPEASIGPTENRSSTVIEHVPGTAIVASRSNDFGKTLKGYLDLYRAEPAYKPMIDQLDQALGLVGGADAAFGWAGDTAIVVNVSDGTPEGRRHRRADRQGRRRPPVHLAARVHRARRRPAGDHRPRRDLQRHDDHHRRPRRSRHVAGMAGDAVSGGRRALDAADRSRRDRLCRDRRRRRHRQRAPGFVKHVLDTTKATSLASNERYKKLADRAGAGIGSAFVDITAIRGLIEKAAGGAADAAGIAKYEKDVKPFLVPFDAMVASSRVNGDMTRSVIYITVK